MSTSVILVTQGDASMLPLAIESLRAQEPADFEVVLVDSSTDGAHNRAISSLADLLESRLPVVRGTQVVGIVSRANMLHALASLSAAAPPPAKTDVAIRQQLLEEFDKQTWAPVALIDVVVKDGVVELWGTITEEAQGAALKVCAENIPGVKSVASHLTWIEPMSGMVISEPEETKA